MHHFLVGEALAHQLEEFPGREAREPAAPTSVAKFDPMLVNAFGICAWAAGLACVPRQDGCGL